MSVTAATGDTQAGGETLPAASSGFVRRLSRRRLAVVCCFYLAAVVGVAIVAPIVLPDIASQHAGNLLAARQGPSWGHLLGTDTLGRDVLNRLLVGTRVTIVGVAEALLVVVLLGVPLGLAAGYFRGWIDRTVIWLADLAFSIPTIVIVIVVLAVFPQNVLAGMTTFGVLAAPGLMRIVRSATLAAREELYVQAAQVSGLSHPYIMVRQILPRIAGAIIVQASLLAAAALLVQTGMAFLGLMVASPAPSWGGMVADGVNSMVLQPWLIWPPAMAIALTVMALGLLGDAVRDTTTEEWAANVAGPRTRRRLVQLKRASKDSNGSNAARLGSAERVEAAQGPLEAAVAVAVKGAARPSSSAKHHRVHFGPASQRETRAVSTEALLSVEALSVSFDFSSGRTHVVEDASFDVASSGITGIVGETGCGKSVTGSAILGLLPGSGRIEGGCIWFEGRNLVGLPERQLRQLRGREIALVSQDPLTSLNPAFTVKTQLGEAVRRLLGLSRGETKRKVVELLASVELPNPEDVARKYPHELSGGMAQRVAIARALAGEPKLLIADEPTTALDVTIQAEILSLLKGLTSRTGMGILLITHDWGVVADACDRAIVMYAGQVVERADIIDMFNLPLHPYTRGLLAANPHNADPVAKLPVIPGAVPHPGAWPKGCHFHPRCPLATTECATNIIALDTPSAGRDVRCIHFEEALTARG